MQKPQAVLPHGINDLGGIGWYIPRNGTPCIIVTVLVAMFWLCPRLVSSGISLITESFCIMTAGFTMLKAQEFDDL